jgi:hypothetical protein
MKELEEHLRTMTEQVKIRRRLVIENKKSVKNFLQNSNLFLSIYFIDIEDGNK